MNDIALLLDYSGKFEFKTIEMLINQAKICVDGVDCKLPVRKKVVNICVECLENIYKYAILGQTDKDFIDNLKTILRIEVDSSSIIVVCGNTILNSNIELLQNRLIEINTLTNKQLRDKYDVIINNNEINEKGGAGLGLIDMALKSGNPLTFQFRPIDNKISFFQIKIKINLNTCI